MCGIAGILAAAWRDDLPRRLEAAAGCLRHRGPDGEGYLAWPAPGGGLRTVGAPGELRAAEPRGPVVALAHRRLSIIDLSPAAGQPMISADGRLAVVLNGEIYNYRELRAELERAGRTFRTSSDTEVLLQGFAAWGLGVLPRLEGMFAFALFDSERRRLLLARDPFGIKPLLLARTATGVAFASEVGAILALTGTPPVADAQAVVDYVERHDTDLPGRTMFAGVERLAAGHLLDLPLDDPASARPGPYWRPTVRRRSVSLAEAAAQVRALFVDAIALHLRSDVPLGFALSGGLDSSAIIGAARQVLGADAELHAFAFVPDDAALSEEPFAAMAARAAGARLHKVTVHPQELADDFADLAWHQGEPFNGPTIYAQRRVFRHAAESGIRVLLEGQGADELLGGYDRYLTARAASLLRQGRLGAAAGLLSRVPGGRTRVLLRASLGALGSVDEALDPLRRMRRRPAPAGFRPAWIERQGVRLGPPPAGARYGGPFTTALVRSLWGNPLQALLRFGDRNAMTASLENRVPFLTTRLADLLLGLPEDHLLAPDGTRKAVLREAMRDLVPAPILARTDKVGFETPVADWLIRLKPWVEHRLNRLGETPLADAAATRVLWQAVQGTRNRTGALQIWRWLSLQAWVERYGVRVPE